jgi:antitoxin component YwqK of YwqJK toxin-antitoxin module
MEADSMARQVQLLVSTALLTFSFLFSGCNNQEDSNGMLTRVRLSSSDAALTNENGTIHLNGQPFSGTLFTLGQNVSDTLLLANYWQGLEHGTWYAYYPESDQLYYKRSFDKGEKIGLYEAYWPNGTKQLSYNFENGVYEGTCREWNDVGFMVKELNYKNGHEDGRQQWWYDNGKIKANYTIVNGRRFGLLGTKNCVNVSDSVFQN